MGRKDKGAQIRDKCDNVGPNMSDNLVVGIIVESKEWFELLTVEFKLVDDVVRNVV